MHDILKVSIVIMQMMRILLCRQCKVFLAKRLLYYAGHLHVQKIAAAQWGS